MTKWLTLAWRDLWRNRRRSFISMSAIAFSVFIISLANSLQTGTYDSMEEIAVRLFPGDIQVQSKGYFDDKSLNRSLTDGQVDYAAFPEQFAAINAVARRITGFGLASADSSSAGAMILGIEPEFEAQITTFSTKIFEGEALTDGDVQSVLLGHILARNLGAGIGDTVVVITQGFRNAMGADLYTVKGTLRTGTTDVDRSLMVMPLAASQYLFSMEGRYTELVVGTNDLRASTRTANAIAATVNAEEVDVLSWRELIPDLQQTRALDDAGNYIFYAFLILLVSFEIFNTTMMSVMERVREYGVMMAIGVRPYQISMIVTFELILKVIIGILAGLLIVGTLVFFLKDNPIQLPPEMTQMYEELGFTIGGISFAARPGLFVFPVVAVLAAGLVSTIYPILRLRTFSPVEALRTD